jgi:proline iminopeptidase
MRLLSIFFFFSGTNFCEEHQTNEVLVSNYFNYGDSLETAGVKMILFKRQWEFKVWTKRFGTNPKLKSYCFTVVQ